MQQIFPSDYKGLFIVGFRKKPDDSTITQRTGTVILKRTYDINPITGQLTPSKVQEQIFSQDYPDNLVINNKFEAEITSTESPPKVELKTEESSEPKHEYLEVSGQAKGRIVQTLTFDKPLGGRQFTFTFLAKADNEAAKIENVQLEANGQVLCQINADLTKTSKRFSVCKEWPDDLKATEMQVVLRMATDSNHTVWYGDVQVYEQLRYEHDLAPFKPKSDIIVLEFEDLLSYHAKTDNLIRLYVNNELWFERRLNINDDPQKAVFGWEPRSSKKRQQTNFPTDHIPPSLFDFKPNLPNGFKYDLNFLKEIKLDFENHFFNGYLRTAAKKANYLPKSAEICFARDGCYYYRFTLPTETITANYYYYNGTGSDTQKNWQQESITMNIDTLVIEPEKDRCYLVWRGVWPFYEHPEETYRLLSFRQ